MWRVDFQNMILLWFVVFVLVVDVSADVCVQYANGCSIPGNLPTLYKMTFTPSCNRHDVCYGCGMLYSISREECDKAFRDNMKKACGSRWLRRRSARRSKRSLCTVHADMYYFAVRIFAESFYHRTIQGTKCLENWVPSCLPVTLSTSQYFSWMNTNQTYSPMDTNQTYSAMDTNQTYSLMNTSHPLLLS